MTTTELKAKLIKKIESTDNDHILKEAIRLMDIRIDEPDDVFQLTAEMNYAIEEARKQIKNGQYLTHEQAVKAMEEWLGE